MAHFICFLIIAINFFEISQSFVIKASWQRLYSKASAQCSSSLTLFSRPENRNEEVLNLEDSMRKARKCSISNLSPGAGLATADEQSDAAYADLINTSIDQRGIDSLSSEELKRLEKGSEMWEKGAKTQTNKFGLLGSISKAFEALSGGAHIVKNDYGQT